jgi:hypothetical protein
LGAIDVADLRALEAALEVIEHVVADLERSAG